jgi:2-amino-4-hydroxy-6-hydroxymethyldihydropteridine diphosphokinase
MNRAYLALGSNIDPRRNLPRAVALLAAAGRVRAVSRVWETAPVGCTDQAPFLNAAVLLETELTPEALKGQVIAGLEERLGRVRDPADRNAPRTIDVDIVLWNDDVGEILGRPVPDPDLLRHAHVAVPVAELEPALIHPVSSEPLAAIARRLAAAARPAPVPCPDVRLLPADPAGA